MVSSSQPKLRPIPAQGGYVFYISAFYFNLHFMPRVVFVVSLFLYFTLICVLPVVFAFVHAQRPVHPCRAHPLCSQCTGVSYNSFLPWQLVVSIEFVFVFVSVFFALFMEQTELKLFFILCSCALGLAYILY